MTTSNDEYTTFTTIEQKRPTYFESMKSTSNNDEIAALVKLGCELSGLTIQRYYANNALTIEEAAKMEKFANFVKGYPIIANLIISCNLFDRKGFKNYLDGLAKKKHVVGGIEVWYKNHIDYAKSQIEYIKCIMRARGINTGSKTSVKYIRDLEKAINEQIDIITNADKCVREQLHSSSGQMGYLRDDVKRLLDEINKNMLE